MEQGILDVLQAIQALRREVEEDITALSCKFDTAIKSHYELKVEIASMKAELSAQINALDKNTSEMWENVRLLEKDMSQIKQEVAQRVDECKTAVYNLRKDLTQRDTDIEKKVDEHLNTTAGRDSSRKTAFQWTNLITPIVVTIGLAVIGVIVGTK